MLAKSFHQHHPNGRCFVLIIDEIDGYIDPADEPFEVIRPDEFGLDSETFLMMATIYDVIELSTAVKPSLLATLIERLDEPVLYLDPDIQIFDTLEEVHRLAAEHHLVLTPHLTEPPPDDAKNPSEVQIVASGAYNLGFVALAPGVDTDKLVRWWARRLRHDCIVDHRMGLFVDQRWFDLAPSLMDDFSVLRDPGYNVAYWNLATRPVARAGEGVYTVRGKPLRFLHYSGYDPSRPRLLSKHQDRISLAEEPVLRELFDGYRATLVANGHEKVCEWPYSYDAMADGTRLTPSLRRVFRSGELAGKLDCSVFSEEGQEQFYAWLREPVDVGGAFGVNQFLAELHHARMDLRAAFPDLGLQEHAEGLVRWAHVHGHEASIPKRLLPPAPPWLEQAAPQHPQPSSAAPPPPTAPTHAAAQTVEPIWGVNVAGYLRSELGVAEAARLAIRALDAVDVPVMPVHGSVIPSSRQQHAFAHVRPDVAPFPVNLICVNADRLPEFVADAGPRFFEGRHRIGMWWWEVSSFPEQSLGAFELLDEVWVGTQHIVDALTPVSSIPVLRVPIPISVPPPPPRSRAELGLPEGFLFLFVFDFHSVLERKNPLGLIEAFERAFPPGAGASLAIKCINGEHHPQDRERVLVAAAEHPDVHVLEHYLLAADKNAMIDSAHCYVSLHRSEGLGLTLAEAMYLGKPVIATGYSGNLDFMTAENGYLVPHSTRPIGPGNAPYPEDGAWAEPDLDEAARLMKRVFADWGEAEQRGKRAAAEIRETHSPRASGEAMKRRLEMIRQRRRAYPPAPRTLPAQTCLDDARATITAGPTRAARSPLGSFAKRGIERLLRYRAVHQRAVDERLADAIASLGEWLTGAPESSLQSREALALVLAELRRQDDAITALRPDAQRLLIAADRLVRESQARPDPAFLPFETFDEGVAGRVYGYRSSAEHRAGYVGFEDMFRGDEELVRRRQQVYLDLLGDRELVLDAGCGRGEFLDLLRDRGVGYLGVDLDGGMVARCREKGHPSVEQGDLNEYLEGLADDSLGAIFSAQVIEHLPLPELERFLALSARKLRGDGVFVAETVNPHSAQALKAFWLDLTHKHPIFPEVALSLCSSAGFSSAFVFHPNASGDVDRDRFEAGDYAIVASPPVRVAGANTVSDTVQAVAGAP